MASSCGVKPGFLNATRWARKANRFPSPFPAKPGVLPVAAKLPVETGCA